MSKSIVIQIADMLLHWQPTIQYGILRSVKKELDKRNFPEPENKS